MRAAFLATGPTIPSLRLPFEVPASISPALAGILVGAASGVLLFGIVLVVTMRASRKAPRERPPAGPRGLVEVVRVPPYTTGSHHVLPPSVPTPPGATLVLQRPLPERPRDPLALAGETPASPRLPEREPHPLGVIRGASLAELELDDSPTEIAETIFDEPPRPLQRGAAPRIRPIAPSPPRRFSPTPSA